MNRREALKLSGAAVATIVCGSAMGKTEHTPGSAVPALKDYSTFEAALLTSMSKAMNISYAELAKDCNRMKYSSMRIAHLAHLAQMKTPLR